MLYDNAQLMELLTHAWLATGDALFKSRIEETVAWLTREMLLSGGAFAASLDADSEGHEGRFYVWTRDEVIAVLGEGEGAFFCDAYDIETAGQLGRRGDPQPPARHHTAVGHRRSAPHRRPPAHCSRIARRAYGPRPTTRCWPTGTA